MRAEKTPVWHYFAIVIPLLLIVGLSVFCFRLVQQIQTDNARREALAQEVATVSAELERARSELTALSQELADTAAALEEAQPPITVAPDYQELYPDLYCPALTEKPVITPKTAYLTFDDGPSNNTPTVLNTLAEHGVKATFFVVGKELTDSVSQQRLRRIAQEGHTIGVHTYSHKYRDIYASVEDYLADFYQTWTQIRDITGVEAQVFRFPGGSINGYNSTVYQEIITEMLRRGFVYYDWNVSSADAASATPTATERILANATNTKGQTQVVILMHDAYGKSTTAKALPGIIDGLQNQGYTLLPLDRSVPAVIFDYKR